MPRRGFLVFVCVFALSLLGLLGPGAMVYAAELEQSGELSRLSQTGMVASADEPPATSETSSASVLDALRQAEADLERGAWFERQGSPFSKLDSIRWSSLYERMIDLLRAHVRAMRVHAKIHRNAYVVEFVFLALCVFLLIRARKWAGEAATRAAIADVVEPVMRRPVAASLLVVLGTSWMFHADAPTLERALVQTMAVIAGVRVLVAAPSGPRGSALYALLGLVAIDWARVLALGSSATGRLVMDVELVGLIAVGTVLAPHMSHVTGPHLAYRRWVPAVIRAVRLLCVAAIVVDLAGWGKLSTVLGAGNLLAMCLLVICIAAYWSLLGVVSALIYAPQAEPIHALHHRRVLVLGRLVALAHWVIPLVWLALACDAYGVLNIAREVVGAVWDAAIHFGEISISIGDILSFVIVVWASVHVSRFVRALLEDDVMARTILPNGVPYAISTTAHYVVVLLGGFLALSSAGVDLTRFTVLAGAVGVGIGFGMQTVVNNFICGLILLYERPIKVGDAIEVEGVLGEVKRIGIRSSTVRTLSGAEVLVPNATLISSNVTNWTLSDRTRRVDVRVGVAYGTDPERVLKLLSETAANNPLVLDVPEPTPLFLGFGDSSLDFELRVWVPNFLDGPVVSSQLTVAINAALRDAAIEIPFPQRDLHLRSVAEGILPRG